MVPATPYRGIQPFRYTDHAIFFEREAETHHLASLISVYRGVLLYGDSGNGKSSLINAGLLPAAAGLGLHAERLRVQPRAGEEIVVERIAVSDDGAEHLPSLLAAGDDAAPRLVLSVDAFVARVVAACTTHRPLLVFDQFEEILTLFEGEAARAPRGQLVDMIVRLLREPLPVKLLFAFREDYLGKVKQLLAACPELVDQALRLGPPQAGALPTIIRGPFERYPGHFEREFDPALAIRLCAALEQRFGAGDVSLSEVQIVCLRLWQADDSETVFAYRGVQGLLEDYLGEALDALAPETRAAAVALLGQMVTSAGTRNVISADDLMQRVRAEEDIPPRQLEHALEQLESKSKLVRRERRRDLFLYEITSEFLVPWISRRREQQRRLQERRRLRMLTAIAAALLLVAAVIAGVAVWALQQRGEARRQATRATSLALASAAQARLSERPDVSVLLAFEAYRENPSPETRGAIIQSLTVTGRPAVIGILHGHTGAVDKVLLSRDGRTLATVGDDKTARLWDARTHRQLVRLPHPSRVNNVAFSPNGRTVVTVGDDKTARLWDAHNHRQLARFTGHTEGVVGVAFSPSGRVLATLGKDKTARLWDIRTHRELARFAGIVESTPGTTVLAFSPDGNTLATVGNNFSTVRLWDTRTHRKLADLRQPGVNAIAFSPDGQTFATGGYGTGFNDVDTALLWDTRTHRRLASLPYRSIVRSIAFSPDGSMLVTGGDDVSSSLWDTHTHRRLARLRTSRVNQLVFSPDGRFLASATEDKIARVWDTRTHTQVARFGHTSPVLDVAFSPDGRTLATASYAGTAQVWNTRLGGRITTYAPALAVTPVGPMLATVNDDGVRLWDIRTHKHRTLRTAGDSDLVFSPNGRTVATAAYAAKTAKLWDTRTAKQLARLPHRSAVEGFAFSPDGDSLAIATKNHTVHVWDIRTDKRRAQLTGHGRSVYDANFSPDGRTLATASEDETARLWDTRTSTQLARLKHAGGVYDVEFNPNGHLLATTSADGRVHLWDVRTFTHRGSVTGTVGALHGLGFSLDGVSFSPDGRTLATVSDDNIARLWDTRTHKQTARLIGHTQVLLDVTFSPDGRTLATGSYDETARLWDTGTHTQLAVLGPGDAVYDVEFSSAGRTLVAASGEGAVSLWTDISWRDDDELRDLVCGLLGTGLSRSEWAQYASGISYRQSCP